MTVKIPATLQQLLSESVEKYNKKLALSFVDGEPITYNEFGNRIKKVQKLLTDLGISKGDKVAIYSHNMPNWGIAYYAIITIGAVAVPLLPDFSNVEVDNILEHSESKLIFVSQRLIKKIDTYQLQSGKDRIKVIIDNFSLNGKNFLNAESADFDLKPKVEPTDLAAIIYTSGTTGTPKGVMLTHKNICTQLLQCYDSQPIDENDVYLSILPLSHTYENSCSLILGIFGGATIYYLEKPPTPNVLMPALKKIKPTVFISVPLIIEKIYRNKILKEIQSKSLTRFLYKISFFRKLIHRKAGKKLYELFGGRLKFFGIGGAKLDPVVERFLYESKIIPYAIGYGLTETAPLATAAVVGKTKVQSCGFPVKNMMMKINNPNPATGEGEVWLKGENVMVGYYKNEKLTSETITSDGWFKSGDLGFVDKTGRLFLRGRLKNIILSASGENIYPEEIESVINNFHHVLESMVVEQKGRLLAMVRFDYEELEQKYSKFKNNISVIIEKLSIELKDYVNSRVSNFSRIAAVIPLADEFEKTASQKIKRYLYTEKIINKYSM